MFKLKSFVLLILAVASLTSVANAAGEDKSCKILTSQPNYTTMTVVANDSFVSGISMLDGKTRKYKGFAVAYKEFDTACQRYIHQRCAKDHLRGAVNYKISYMISDKMYYFSAQFDYFKQFQPT